jgi:hypothetical protein
MTKLTIANIVNEYNTYARVLNEKTISTKTSIKRDVLIERLNDLRERANANTDVVTLVELCREHNANAKIVRARFRAMMNDANMRDKLPAPVAKHTYRRIDVAQIIEYIR